MGFFSNINANAALGIYQAVCEFLHNTPQDKFCRMLVSNSSTENEAMFSFKELMVKRGNPMLYNGINIFDPNISNDDYNTVVKSGSNYLFKVDEKTLEVSFMGGIRIHKLEASDIPFKISADNQVTLVGCSDSILDWLPEKLYRLCLRNTYRKNKTISFKNFRSASEFNIIGNTQITSLKGLENVECGHFIIKNCKKLKSLEGAPVIKKISNNDDRLDISISSCPELETLYANSNEEINIYVDSKNCPKVDKILSLPKAVNMLMCKTLKYDTVMSCGSVITWVELMDYKGKGTVQREISNDRNEIVNKLKAILDTNISKRWRMFDDLHAVATIFGLVDYFNVNSTANGGPHGYDKSRFVEDGMIHSFDPEGDVVHYGRYATGISRICIKKGVCNYLNRIGARYEIINTDPKKKKEFEFIKVIW